MKTHESSDLFQSASLLCLGAELKGTEKRGRELFFLLEGDEIDKTCLAYRLGQTRVNPIQLRDTLNLLRDMIFENKRDRDERYSRTA